MKTIVKTHPPKCLTDFIDGQLAIVPEPVNLTYSDFRDKSKLLGELTSEQHGLCGYTGAPVDAERLAKLKSPSDGVAFKNHVEHLKCQDACKKSVVDAGGVFGRNLGDDLNYLNMIAALEVRGAESEHFGAVKKKNSVLPVLPTQDGCSDHFCFREVDGGVVGLTAEGAASIEVLRLDHETLNDWRRSAIEAWLDPDVIQSRDDFEEVVRAVEISIDGYLPEFAFVIGSIARGYL
ncbi:hypothetical protein [uncultured Zoogloea sp.]|jgi:hypothetical protein|uniref:hypothetical protein n=1 Tax=uncultured Zoogloea sp. TaxID=160237 RepID=UPI0026325A8A|nr:hypothetical protein [uncultured Zoogloea sp.]